MPLRDHFQPPLTRRIPWESFHSTWANTMVAQLNQRLLPSNYHSLPHVHVGTRVEIDVATFHAQKEEEATGNGAAVAVWAPAQAKLAVEVDFADLDTFEVRVQDETYGHLVAAIELISPANKDRPSNRRNFAIKCASYLQQQVSLVIVDVVTTRRDNLHQELMQLLKQPTELVEAVASALYAVAYRIHLRDDDRHQLELWPEILAVGTKLPTLPLWISEEIAVPLDLEASYRAASEALRLT